jgi:hypothetical protein
MLIEYAPEHPPIADADLKSLLWHTYQSSEWNVRDVSMEFQSLKDNFQSAISLLKDTHDAHCDPRDNDYNECEKDPCHWCEQYLSLKSTPKTGTIEKSYLNNLKNKDLKQKAQALLNDLLSQDNRHTKTPIYYEIWDLKWHQCHDSADDTAFYNPTTLHIIFGEENAIKWCQETYIGSLEINHINLFSMMEEMGYTETGGCEYIRERSPDTPIFLTEKEALDYIENQRHNLNEDPCTFVKSAYACNDLILLIDVLKDYCSS